MRESVHNRCGLKLFLSHNTSFSGLKEKELSFDVINRLGQRITKLFKILFVEEYLVLLIFFLSNPFAFRDRDIEVLFRLRRFHVEEVRALAGSHALGEDFIFVVVFQRPASK